MPARPEAPEEDQRIRRPLTLLTRRGRFRLVAGDLKRVLLALLGSTPSRPTGGADSGENVSERSATAYIGVGVGFGYIKNGRHLPTSRAVRSRLFRDGALMRGSAVAA